MQTITKIYPKIIICKKFNNMSPPNEESREIQYSLSDSQFKICLIKDIDAVCFFT